MHLQSAECVASPQFARLSGICVNRDHLLAGHTPHQLLYRDYQVLP